MTLSVYHRTFLVAHPGARMNYAVPRILSSAGLLDRVYTDFCATSNWSRFLRRVPDRFRPKFLQLFLARNLKNIPDDKITAFNLHGLHCQYRVRMAKTPAERTRTYLWSGSKFCQKILSKGFGNAAAVYTFNSSGLELLQAAQRKGLLAVMEQTIAPKRVECELVASEAERFPGWEAAEGHDELAVKMIDREGAEWQATDVIICGSEFVREGIVRCGGPAEKCVVVPYGVDMLSPQRGEGSRSPDEVASINLQPSTLNRPLRVLTVGAVGLRKGSPYVLQAARRLKGQAQFRMVGTLAVTLQTQAQLREHLELIGRVPRNEVRQHFEWADVFLLPSVCEGSATVSYEALAYGLPVICTPNTGSVVRDGVDGFIIPMRDVDAIQDRLERLASDIDLRVYMSAKARERAEEFTLAAYGRRLVSALS
ncbi:MAG: glycosyltransferase family 4 protein [Verrucomicrobiota bacterium]|jgi:glycosyltransferase involved in cell wall biosynthesis